MSESDLTKNTDSKTEENAAGQDSTPASAASGASAKDRKYSWLLLVMAFVIPFSMVAAVRFMSMKSGDSTTDAYYHVRIAEMGPSVFCAKKFPWTTMSIWSDTFADKELGYHFMTWGLYKLKAIVPFTSDGPPFHFYALPFIALVILAFIYAARKLGVSPPTILIASIVMPLFTPTFTFRLLMMRPHVLSIAVLLFVCGLLTDSSIRRKSIWMFALSFIFAWSYSNPHFIMIPVFFFAITGIRRDSWRSFIPLAFSGVGVIMGLIIHPQFPNTLYIWKAQCIDALLVPLLTVQGAISKPMEMLPPGFSWYVMALPFIVLSYFNIMVFTRIWERRSFRNIPANTLAVGMLSVFFMCSVFAVLRAIEYAVPFVCLFGAMLFDEALRENIILPFRSNPYRARLFAALIALVIAMLSSARCIATVKHEVKIPVKMLEWVRANIPEGTVVANLDWSDFPTVFYADPKRYYLWGMDPMFSYMKDPHKTLAFEKLRPGYGRKAVHQSFLSLNTGTQYAYLLAPRLQQMEVLTRDGWPVVYAGEDGCIFKTGDYTKNRVIQKREK